MAALSLRLAVVLAVVPCGVGLLVSAHAQAPASDWPQFLGPTRDGIYTGSIAESWPPAGPRVVWKKRVGQGFSGPVVTQGRVILFHRVANEEVVEALDARTGEARWRYAYPTNYRDDFGFDEGPRSVPVVAGGRVYTFGAQGQLHAIEFETGRRVWSEDTARRYGVRKGFFGAAGSPLVEDGRVIANIGGRDAGIVAFDGSSGRVLWTATDHEASYSSGIAATIAGTRLAIFFTREGLVGLDPAAGSIAFSRRWRSRLGASVNGATPLVVGDLIFISATYGTGAAVLRLEGSQLIQLWASDDVLSNHYASSVYYDGHLYGYHGRQEYNPSFRAVELRTGRVRWSVDEFRAGTVTLAGNRLLIMRETGELVLGAASPDAFRPLARAQILPPTVRAYPALAAGFLYVRNDDTLVCLDLRP
jgi:outer membrane protein assembly factor BamB